MAHTVSIEAAGGLAVNLASFMRHLVAVVIIAHVGLLMVVGAAVLRWVASHQKDH